MDSLLVEYKQSLKSLKLIREEAPESDQKIFAGMVSSLDYVTKWLRDGRQPATKKSRQVTWNPEWEEYSDHHDDPLSKDAFEEAEERIDAELRRRRRLNA